MSVKSLPLCAVTLGYRVIISCPVHVDVHCLAYGCCIALLGSCFVSCIVPGVVS